MVRVGVTGGAGYVGGRLVQRLMGAGTEVKVVDDSSGPVNSTQSGLETLKADFASEPSLKLLSDCDIVLHLAARSGVVLCERDPIGTSLVNVEGTRKLALFLKERKIPVAFASSFAVVGIPKSNPITESTPPNPPHVYAREKAEGEGIMRELDDPEGAFGAVLRMSNLYGSYRVDGRRVAKGNLINLYAREAEAGHNLNVYKPGTQLRDFINIEDVCSHWEAALRYLLRPGRPTAVPTFNVASGKSISVIDIANLMAKDWNELHNGERNVKVMVVDNPRADVEILHGEFKIDASWTKKTLGVKCNVELSEGVEATLRDYTTI